MLRFPVAIAGWFADRSSSRQVPLLVGLALAFTATLVFCFARTPWLLVVARAFQGFSASIIYTAGLALIADTVPANEVGSWYSAPCPRQWLYINVDTGWDSS